MQKKVRAGKTDLAFGAVFLPLILIFQYGVLAIAPAAQAAFWNEGIWGTTASSYLLAFLIILIASVSFYVGFLGSPGPKISYKSNEGTAPTQERMLWGFFITVLLIDLLIRLDQIQSGTYFSWMRAILVKQGEELGPLAMIQESLYSIVLVLSVYFSKNSRFAYYYIFAILIFVFLAGERNSLVLSVVALYFALWQTGGISRRIIRRELLLLLPAIYLAMQVIIQARVILRFDPASALAAPVDFLLNAFFQAIVISIGLQDGDIYSRASLSGAGLVERTAAWSYCFAYQVQQIFRGYDFFPLSDAFLEFSRSIPSALWPGQKPLVLSGANLVHQFDMPIRRDPATTVFSSAFLHFGFFGLLIFSYFIGVSYRFFLAWSLKIYGAAGRVLFLGFISFFSVMGNSFSASFANIRNLLIVLAVGYVAGFLIKCIKPMKLA